LLASINERNETDRIQGEVYLPFDFSALFKKQSETKTLIE